jgi:hypothetical protein
MRVLYISVLSSQIILSLIFFWSLLVIGFPNIFLNKYSFISYFLVIIPPSILIINKMYGNNIYVIFCVILLDIVLIYIRLFT